MADDFITSDGKSEEKVSLELRRVLEEEMTRYFDQLDVMILELETARKNESDDERRVV